MVPAMNYEEFLKRVKTGIVTEAGKCPVTPLLLILQGKWKNQVLYELCMKELARFGELKKNLEGITNTMLTSALCDLEKEGLVRREQFNEMSLRVEYSFTQKGKDLMSVLYEMMNWGFKYGEAEQRAI